MTKTNQKKLTLNRETVRSLDRGSLAGVHGGALEPDGVRGISRRHTNCMKCGTVGSVDVCPSLDACDPTIDK